MVEAELFQSVVTLNTDDEGIELRDMIAPILVELFSETRIVCIVLVD